MQLYERAIIHYGLNHGQSMANHLPHFVLFMDTKTTKKGWHLLSVLTMPIEKPRQTWMMKKGAETPVRTRILSQRQEQLPPLRDILSIGVLSDGRLLPPSVRHFNPQMISRKLYWRGRLANGTPIKLHFCQQRFHWFPPFCEYYRHIRGIIYVSYAMERTLTAPLSVILKAAHPKTQSDSPLCLLEAETCHVSCGCRILLEYISTIPSSTKTEEIPGQHFHSTHPSTHPAANLSAFATFFSSP